MAKRGAFAKQRDLAANLVLDLLSSKVSVIRGPENRMRRAI